MRKDTRLTALLLAGTMLFSLTGCKKKKEVPKVAQTVSDEQEWYNVEHATLETHYEQIQDLDFQVLDVEMDGSVALITGHEGFDRWSAPYETEPGPVFRELVVFDMSGVSRARQEIDTGADYEMVSYEKRESFLYVYLNSPSTLLCNVVTVDLAYLRIVETNPWDVEPFTKNGKTYFERDMKTLPDGRVVSLAEEPSRSGSGDTYVVLRNEGKIVTSLALDDCSELDTDWDGNIWLFQTQEEVIDGVMMTWTSTARFDPASNSVTPLGTSPKTRTDVGRCSFYNGKMYSVSAFGIDACDTASGGDTSRYFSFDNCNIDRVAATGMTLLSTQPGEIVLAGRYQRGKSDMNHYDVIRITKAATTPNAGKTIIEVGVPGQRIDAVLSRTLCEFNSTQKPFFAVLRFYDYDLDFSPSTDEELIRLVETRKAFSDQIMQEIRDGVAPDVIWNLGTNEELDMSNLLLDLTPYLSRAPEFEPGTIFMNIVKNNKQGDKQYQIPMAYELCGIRATEADQPQNQRGYTIEEFEEKTWSDGSDTSFFSTGRSRLVVFGELFSYIENSMIDRTQNVANFDCEELRELAQFCKDNFPAEGVMPQEIPVKYSGAQSKEKLTLIPALSDLNAPARIVMNHFSDTKYMNDTTVYGLASNGSGPAARVLVSGSVPVSALNPEASWIFIRTALSAEVQSAFVGDGVIEQALPVNRMVLLEYSEGRIKDDDILAAILSSSPPQVAYDFDPLTLTEYAVFIQSIEDTDTNLRYNDSHYIIVLKEMQKYFDGEESLDDALFHIDEEIQKLLDEAY
ncbi:MAG: hypothetical protein J6Y08_10595 [Clostridiales bacterium]|nr:hypothetical protein [Clostridiales bacterium]